MFVSDVDLRTLDTGRGREWRENMELEDDWFSEEDSSLSLQIKKNVQ